MDTKKPVRVISIDFTPLGRHQALAEMFRLSAKDKASWVVTSNLDHVVLADTDRRFQGNIHKSDFIVADGWPIELVLRLLGHPFAQRIAGSDFLPSSRKSALKTANPYT